MHFIQSLHRASSGKGRRPGAGWREGWRSWLRDDTGAVAVITALCLLVFVALLALVLDIGHLMAVRSELQNAADASALAGARSLRPPLESGNRLSLLTDNPSCSTALTVARNLVNQTDNQNIAVAPVDVQIGHWGWPGENFRLNQFVARSSCSTNINAIRVIARKDQSINQPVTTWFARVLGIDQVDVTSRPAVAALGYVSGVEAGRAFPIAINQEWLEEQLRQPPQSGGIKFNPDGQDNGGWASPMDQNPSAANLKDWIANGLPERITMDDQINLNNGTINSALQELASQLPGHTQPYHICGCGTTDSGWLVLAPVVAVDKFNQSTKVVYFQPMVIVSVDTKKSKTIEVVFPKDPVLVDGGLSGGPKSKVYANIPRLVQ